MFRCAFYETEITPPLGSEIPGYYEVRVSTGVLDKLYLKSFLLDDGVCQAAIIVLDAVELPNDFCVEVREQIYQRAGLSPERIILCATHTHLGIPCGEPHGSNADKSYMAELCRRAADSVLLAQQHLQPCRIRFGSGYLDGLSFNRDYVMGDGSICTNPGKRAKSPVLRHYADADFTLPVLYVEALDGSPLGALISFACHQDCIGGTKYSGDYSSELSRQMKEAFGAAFVSIYLAGASGDINNYDYLQKTKIDYLTIGRAMAREAIRVIRSDAQKVLGTTLHYASGSLCCRYRRASASEIARAKAHCGGDIQDSHIMLGSLMSELLLEYESRMQTTGLEYGQLPVHVISFGDISIFALPGELYHQFADSIRTRCPERKCFIITLCHGSFGYIPIPELFGTSVYPVQLCECSMWTPDTGDAIVNLAVQLAKQN